MLSIPQILVATDFSPQSDLALKAALALKQKTNGRIHVVHVVHYPKEWDSLAAQVGENYFPKKFREDMLRSLNELLSEQVRRCELGSDVRKDLLFGNPLKVITEVIQKEKIDLLILGKVGSGVHDGHFHMGSLTSRLAASCKVPLLILSKPWAMNKVAALVDPVAPRADLVSLSEEISFLHSCELEVISLWQNVLSYFSKGSLLRSSFSLELNDKEREEIIEEIRKRLTPMLDEHSKARVMVGMASEKGVGRSVVDHLELENVDLAILGRHPKSVLETYILGSVVRTVLERFTGNALILPPSSDTER